MSNKYSKNRDRRGSSSSTTSSSSTRSSKSRSRSSSSSSSNSDLSDRRRGRREYEREREKYHRNQYDEFDLEPRNPQLLSISRRPNEDEHSGNSRHSGQSHHSSTNVQRRTPPSSDDDDDEDEDIDGVPIDDQPRQQLDNNCFRSDKSSDHSAVTLGGSNNSGNNNSGARKISFAGRSTDGPKTPEPPSPPIISKTRIQFGKPGSLAKVGIQMKLAPPKPKAEPVKKMTVAQAFQNEDDEDETEEMPAECKMRMRNIGRDTPTSSGPNSFGKTKQGFVDTKKVFERSLRQAFAD